MIWGKASGVILWACNQVMPYISSANVACGGHAGDPLVMNATVLAAKSHNVGIGAHPGYPDLMGFGRRHMALTPEEIRHHLVYQIGSLHAFCQVHQVKLQHIKPHGALYLDALENPHTAGAIVRAVRDIDPSLFLVTLAGKKSENMCRMAEEMGLRVILEAFPDRAYTSQGTLTPRSQPNALITDPGLVAKRALDMAEGFVITEDESRLELDVQTICVHGDNKEAVNLVRSIRARLEAGNIRIAPMSAACCSKHSAVME